MPKRLGFVVVAVALVATWNLDPVRTRRVQVWHLLQTGTNVVTGREALHVGQDIRRGHLRNSLDLALREYRQLNGEDPCTLQDLVTAGVLQQADLADEWGRPLLAERGQQGLVIRGLGPDGRRDTEDDWTLGD